MFQRGRRKVNKFDDRHHLWQHFRPQGAQPVTKEGAKFDRLITKEKPREKRPHFTAKISMTVMLLLPLYTLNIAKRHKADNGLSYRPNSPAPRPQQAELIKNRQSTPFHEDRHGRRLPNMTPQIKQARPLQRHPLSKTAESNHAALY
jgi:hypothetical protein